MEKILEIKNLVKSFGGINAVNDCSFSVKSGSITGLIGPNGAGKTTVFNLIGGLFNPTSGKIYFDAQDITNEPMYARSTRGISRTFQDVRIFPNLTAIENILVALEGNNQKLTNCFKKTDDTKYFDDALSLLKKVNLHEKANFPAISLSYGQQKLIEIMRAYASHTKLLILDEPASGINPTLLNEIKDLIRELQALGMTFLIIEHDMNFIFDICDTIIVLKDGAVIAEGTPSEIKSDKKVIDAYLGG